MLEAIEHTFGKHPPLISRNSYMATLNLDRNTLERKHLVTFFKEHGTEIWDQLFENQKE